MTDSILSLIDNAIEDYGLGPDAMRWRPEAPEEDRSASTVAAGRSISAQQLIDAINQAIRESGL